jgi:hypothetical protein
VLFIVDGNALRLPYQMAPTLQCLSTPYTIPTMAGWLGTPWSRVRTSTDGPGLASAQVDPLEILARPPGDVGSGTVELCCHDVPKDTVYNLSHPSSVNSMLILGAGCMLLYHSNHCCHVPVVRGPSSLQVPARGPQSRRPPQSCKSHFPLLFILCILSQCQWSPQCVTHGGEAVRYWTAKHGILLDKGRQSQDNCAGT